MSKSPKKKVHPIVEDVLKLASKGVDEVEFDDYAVEQIEDLLKSYSKEPNFLNAMVDLINLAGILEQEHCLKASLKLIIAISSVADYLKK